MSSRRDYEQVIQDVHDEANHALQVNLVAGTVTVNNPSVGTNGDPAPTSSNEVAGIRESDGTLTPISIRDDGGVRTSDQGVQDNTSSIFNDIDSRLSGSLVPAAFDEIDLTYVASGNGVGQVETATYKFSSSVVKTLTLTYDSSNRLTSVVAS